MMIDDAIDIVIVSEYWFDGDDFCCDCHKKQNDSWLQY